MAPVAAKRLAKELDNLQKGDTPTGCAILKADDFSEWLVSISVLGDETVYRGETFCLRFRFSGSYPIDSPEVTFVVDKNWKAPVHPHIYTNGHLCLSILGTGWSPVLNVASICLSIQSMLASCKDKKLPSDNDRYIKHAPLSPKNTQWAFHDDTI